MSAVSSDARPSRPVRASAWPLVVCLAWVCTPPAGAQVVSVAFYHGARNSQPIAYEVDGEGLVGTSRSRLRFEVRPGSEVCVRVVNAHRVLYDYSLEAEVDTSGPVLPDYAELLALVSARLAVELPDSSARVANAWDREYLDSINALAEDIDSVLAAVRRSDLPETFEPATGPAGGVLVRGERRGLAHVVDYVASRSKGSFQFGDPNLDSTVARFHRRMTDAAQGDSTLRPAHRRLLLDLFQERLKSLASTVRTLREAYTNVPPSWLGCHTIDRGTHTIHLKVEARDKSLARSRDTGAAATGAMELEVVAEFARPVLEVVPLVMMSFADDVAEFSVRDGVVSAARGRDQSFRAGSMVLANLARWGEGRGSAVGVGLGVGVGGQGKVLSDVLGGVLFSWRDVLRVGAGLGMSSGPHSLKAPAQEGEPLPEEVTDLTDLVEPDMHRSFYVVFSLFGLALPGG